MMLAAIIPLNCRNPPSSGLSRVGSRKRLSQLRGQLTEKRSPLTSFFSVSCAHCHHPIVCLSFHLSDPPLWHNLASWKSHCLDLLLVSKQAMWHSHGWWEGRGGCWDGFPASSSLHLECECEAGDAEACSKDGRRLEKSLFLRVQTSGLSVTDCLAWISCHVRQIPCVLERLFAFCFKYLHSCSFGGVES